MYMCIYTWTSTNSFILPSRVGEQREKITIWQHSTSNRNVENFSSSEYM